MPTPRTRWSHPVLLLVLIVILVATIGHVVLWVTMPLLWIALLVAAVLFATRHPRRPRPRRDR
jgi:Flp pilus assembly protein TadB